MKDFKLIQQYLGYQSKKDITNTDPRYLVTGSHDVLINDGEKIVTRNGYSLYGEANSALTPIESAYDWNTSTGVERHLRSYNDKLEYLYTSGDTVSWRTLLSGLSTAVDFSFAEWWSSTEAKDLLIMVNGSSNLYSWSGGITTFASATTNTITKQGTNTWGQDRFLVSGTRKVVIGGTEYTYTGGEGTTTLTGVTPDPTLAGHAVGAIIHQAVTTTANKPASTFGNDVIKVHKNQLYVGDTTRRDVYVSKNTDYTDFSSPTSPRLPGEAGLLTLDSAVVGFETQEDAIYISSGKSDWYQVNFTLSSDNTAEAISVEKLKSGPQQAAQSQNLIGKIKNSIIFVSNEPTLDSLGRVENINTPQSLPLSDPIKADFDDYDFTNGSLKYYKNQTLIALPEEDVVLVYDHQNSYWQPPQNMGISRFSIIDGELYGHSSAVPETYKIFDQNTMRDNDNPINHVARFAYRNFNNRARRKRFDEYYIEGYVSPNTELTVTYRYEYGASQAEKTKTFTGSNLNTIFDPISDGSLGKQALGHSPLGGVPESENPLQKFRTIQTLSKDASFEYQTEFSSNEIDYQWQILAHGPNAVLSTNDNVDIKT